MVGIYEFFSAGAGSGILVAKAAAARYEGGTVDSVSSGAESWPLVSLTAHVPNGPPSKEAGGERNERNRTAVQSADHGPR